MQNCACVDSLPGLAGCGWQQRTIPGRGLSWSYEWGLRQGLKCPRPECPRICTWTPLPTAEVIQQSCHLFLTVHVRVCTCMYAIIREGLWWLVLGSFTVFYFQKLSWLLSVAKVIEVEYWLNWSEVNILNCTIKTVGLAVCRPGKNPSLTWSHSTHLMATLYLSLCTSSIYRSGRGRHGIRHFFPSKETYLSKESDLRPLSPSPNVHFGLEYEHKSFDNGLWRLVFWSLVSERVI